MRNKKTSVPFTEFGCTFRVIPTSRGFELQRIYPSSVIKKATFWKYVKDFKTLQEVSDYIDDLGNAVFNITMDAKAAFFVEDACNFYINNTVLSEDEIKTLERTIQKVKNNLKDPTEDF